MKKILSCALALMLLGFGALAEPVSPADACQRVLEKLEAGEYEAVLEMLNDETRQALSAQALQQAWEAQLSTLGALVSVAPGDIEMENMASLKLIHADGAQQLVVGVDENGGVNTLMLQPTAEAPEAEARALPEGVEARDVRLFSGTERELGGTIISPAGADADTPYVLLIQGSGASDRDEAVGAIKPFRDLAYDLAALGVGSLRFDKVTYAHPTQPVESVVQEYLEPVLEGLRVLREETGAARIYATGHSEGGILMPWLVSESGADGFAGGIALAGTPHPLWQISYAQNLKLIEDMPISEEERAAYLEQIEAERAHAETLLDMTDEQARASTVFGVNAFYQKSIAALDEIALAKETGRPMLFLWGEADFQVYEADFEAWREGLGESELYTYVRYPGLNHVFMPAREGDGLSNAMQVYMRPAVVEPKVSQDIANWIFAQ